MFSIEKKPLIKECLEKNIPFELIDKGIVINNREFYSFYKALVYLNEI